MPASRKRFSDEMVKLEAIPQDMMTAQQHNRYKTLQDMMTAQQHNRYKTLQDMMTAQQHNRYKTLQDMMTAQQHNRYRDTTRHDDCTTTQ